MILPGASMLLICWIFPCELNSLVTIRWVPIRTIIWYFLYTESKLDVSSVTIAPF
jgi:hypothetical protein